MNDLLNEKEVSFKEPLNISLLSINLLQYFTNIKQGFYDKTKLETK